MHLGINNVLINTDALAIITDWSEFNLLDKLNNVIFDGRQVLKNPFYQIGVNERI